MSSGRLDGSIRAHAAMTSDRFIRRDLHVSRMNGGRTLLQDGSGHVAETLPDPVAAAIMGCVTFDTLLGHATRALRGLGLDESARPALERELARLAQRDSF